MSRFFSFLFALALVVLICVAFLRGWVNFSVFNKEEAGESGATMTIDKNKVKDDISAAKHRIHQISKDVKPEKDRDGDNPP